jgi:hypothetical protein
MKKMNKRYSSFEEIDRELQILELQRKLDWEHIKLNGKAIKTTLYPPNIGKRIENVVQQAALTFVLKKLVARRAKKKQKELEFQS